MFVYVEKLENSMSENTLAYKFFTRIDSNFGLFSVSLGEDGILSNESFLLIQKLDEINSNALYIRAKGSIIRYYSKNGSFPEHTSFMGG